MPDFVILGRVGAHVLDQLELVLALAERPGSGVGAGAWLRTVEVAIPFASFDGADVSPTTVLVGETPLPLEEARTELLALQQQVRVRAADLDSAPETTRGTLVLRVALPRPADETQAPSDDSNPNT